MAAIRCSGTLRKLICEKNQKLKISSQTGSIPLTFVRRNSTVLTRIDVPEEKEKKQLYCIDTVVRKEVM